MLTVEQLTGLCERHLVQIDDYHWLHPDTLKAWQAMQQDAEKAGLKLTIASSYRSFQRQRQIWNGKFCGERPVKDQHDQLIDITQLLPLARIHAIMLFSALPGLSRHHWGTDLDIYDANAIAADYKLQLEPWEYQPDGPFAKLTDWLQQYSHQYGFSLPYQRFTGGVAIEPWHISFQPIAEHCQAKVKPTLLANVLLQHPIAGQDDVLANLSSLFNRYFLNRG